MGPSQLLLRVSEAMQPSRWPVARFLFGHEPLGWTWVWFGASPQALQSIFSCVRAKGNHIPWLEQPPSDRGAVAVVPAPPRRQPPHSVPQGACRAHTRATKTKGFGCTWMNGVDVRSCCLGTPHGCGRSLVCAVPRWVRAGAAFPTGRAQPSTGVGHPGPCWGTCQGAFRGLTWGYLMLLWHHLQPRSEEPLLSAQFCCLMFCMK